METNAPIGPSLLMVGDVFWLAFLVSAVFAYPLWKLLIKLKSQQNVSAHLQSHQAKQGTPTMGGIIIACGALAAYVVQAAMTSEPHYDDPSVVLAPNYSL